MWIRAHGFRRGWSPSVVSGEFVGFRANGWPYGSKRLRSESFGALREKEQQNMDKRKLYKPIAFYLVSGAGVLSSPVGLRGFPGTAAGDGADCRSIRSICARSGIPWNPRKRQNKANSGYCKPSSLHATSGARVLSSPVTHLWVSRERVGCRGQAQAICEICVRRKRAG